MATVQLEPKKKHASPTGYPQGAKGDRQALVALQRRMWAKAHDDKVPVHIQAACTRVWRDLQETKRIMDGKPLPGMLRPDLEQRGTNKSRRQKMPSVLPLPEVPVNSASVPSKVSTP
jgi:hypothetical protein